MQIIRVECMRQTEVAAVLAVVLKSAGGGVAAVARENPINGDNLY